MIYAQVNGGQKLHLAYEPGEGKDNSSIIRAGFISNPICGRPAPNGYRMTCNLPLANACKRCLKVYKARHGA